MFSTGPDRSGRNVCCPVCGQAVRAAAKAGTAHEDEIDLTPLDRKPSGAAEAEAPAPASPPPAAAPSPAAPPENAEAAAKLAARREAVRAAQRHAVRAEQQLLREARETDSPPPPLSPFAAVIDADVARATARTTTARAPHPEPAPTVEGGLFISDAELARLSDPPQASDGEVLEYRVAIVNILMTGAVGLVVGILAGALLGGESRLLSAYIGAFAGWIVGFVIAFIGVASAEEALPESVRCPFCNKVFPAGTASCDWCGGRIRQLNIDPLAADSLNAGRFALRNLRPVVRLAAPAAVLGFLFAGWHALHAAFPDGLGPARPFVLGAFALAGLYVLACWFWFPLEAMSQTLLGRGWSIRRAGLWSPGHAAKGAQAFLVLAAYLLPFILFPLLPVALLSLGTAGPRRAFDPRRALAIVRKHPKNFAILWLFLLFWTAGLAVPGLLALLGWRLGEGLQFASPWLSIPLSLVVGALGAWLLAAVVCTYLLVLACCIGMFGRRNAEAEFYARRADATASDPKV